MRTLLLLALLSFPAFAEEEIVEQTLDDTALSAEVTGAATVSGEGGTDAAFTQASYNSQTYSGPTGAVPQPDTASNAPPPILGILPQEFINSISRPDAGR